MNEISFVYYGDGEEIQSPLLRKLNVLEFRSRSPERAGLYVVERKYGQEIIQPAQLGVSDTDAPDTAFVIYRFLSAEEQEKLRREAGLRKVYFLCHNFLNFEHIAETLAGTAEHGSFYFVVADKGEDFKTETWVVAATGSKKIYVLQRPRPRDSVDSAAEAGGKWKLPLLLAALFRLLLNPLNELSRYAVLLKYSNLRVLTRAVELGLFFGFLFAVFYGYLQFLGGLFRVVAIKAGWLIRHILLMCGFKSFGVFVDSYQFVLRILSGIRQLFYYKTVHAFYHKTIKPLLTRVWVEYISVFVFDIVLRFLGFVWQKFLSVIIFDLLISKIYHRFFRKIFAFLWIHIFSFLIFDVLLQFFHKVLRPIWDFIWLHFLSFVVFEVVLRFYHRLLRPLFTFLFYDILLRFFVVIWTSILSPLIYDVIVKGSYIVAGLSLRGLKIVQNFIIYDVGHFIIYDIRHFLLMTYYKTYGFAVDFALFCYRITKLYVLYPVRKIYWFCDFQYRKRIKKSIGQ